jgi:hypothetical protein
MLLRHKFEDVVLLILLFIPLLLPDGARADMPSLDYPVARCNPGEEMVICESHSDEPLGPLVKDECAPYRENPNYRLLTYTGGSFGGSSKYCLSPDAPATRVRIIDTGFRYKRKIRL